MRRSTALSLTALPLAATAQADTAAWHILDQIEVTEVETADSWSVVKSYPPEIAGGAPDFEITGYLVPVGWEAETRDFMLVSDLGQCPFCGSGDHGTAIEVRLADPLPAAEEGRRATLRGALHPVRDADTMQAVVMTDAVLVGS
ncbi:hypothetical protein [Jannaschia ovalis]|uniref:DUF3299 domain-containing protein n=1 Tax=Jannaschia ovalis TaxID=3038773 RepID=A0ABY8LEN4_9RHOB|nr:hypothetical protein [Jannaschia sp. GRR-S6-38]WGH79767.1 hypothetical protein P8627_05760 [Jannaschia sp. GRR-S6-38]